MIYAEPHKAYVREGADSALKHHRNTACLWGNGNASDDTGIGVYATSVPEFAMPGSFTAEGFYLLVSNATNKAVHDGNDRQPLMNELRSGTQLGWGVRTDNGNQIVFFCCKVTNLVTGAMSAWNANQFSTDFTTGVWHHVAVVYDDAARPRTLSLYLDYELKKSFGIDDGEELVRMGNGTFYLCGSRSNNANTTWFGGFDEFRFTHKALKPEEFLVSSAGAGLRVMVR